MARMRWMSDMKGRTVAVCPRCDREVPADAQQTVYCYCRSGPDQVVALDLAPTPTRPRSSRAA